MENKNIVTYEKLVKPHDLSEVLPTDAQITGLVTKTRREIAGIICGAIDKMLFVVGPCSVHNVNEAYAYGRELRQLAKEVEDKILIVMRVYFEKPRTTVGWKGLINDPELNSTFKVNDGLYLARKLLIDSILGLGDGEFSLQSSAALILKALVPGQQVFIAQLFRLVFRHPSPLSDRACCGKTPQSVSCHSPEI